MKILLVEDELALTSVIQKRLRLDNIHVEVCHNGADALQKFEGSGYDLIVADIMLPKLDGLSMLYEIRDRACTTPVLLITARDSLDDKLKAFKFGADDYLVKPFELEELVARIHALLRRSKQKGSDVLIAGPLHIDPLARNVKLNGTSIQLTAKEFDLLYFMASNSNIVLSRQKILDHVWEYNYETYSNLIDVYIKDLRKKVDIDPERKLIHTVRGIGYLFKTEDF